MLLLSYLRNILHLPLTRLSFILALLPPLPVSILQFSSLVSQSHLDPGTQNRSFRSSKTSLFLAKQPSLQQMAKADTAINLDF